MVLGTADRRDSDVLRLLHDTALSASSLLVHAAVTENIC